MSSIQPSHYELLKTKLQTEFVPHLPVLLTNSKPPDQQALKNLSRAFSAFVISQLCTISPMIASGAVVDDFDDKGIDAIYYNAGNKTLYLVQSKFKQSEQFKEEDSLKFCRGIRDLIKPDLTNFNTHVQRRQTEIYDAIEKCNQIQLVVAHIGNGISDHARSVINDFLGDDTHGEQQRLCSEFIDYDAQHVIHDLNESEAPTQINEALYIYKHSSISEPRITHFGLVSLLDLANLHNQYGLALYEKNIRTFLGTKTGVNSAIRQTLADEPTNFVYLNNGVTALFKSIEPKGNRASDNRKRLELEGLSIVNGSQTISSAARFIEENLDADISPALVSITLIQVSPEEDFGKAITQARNYQNQVSSYNFAALDDEQERLRRDLSHLNIHYAYKEGILEVSSSLETISLDEAAHALALFQNDPRFTVWLKRDPVILRTFGSDQYKLLFSSVLTAQQLVNAVRFRRFIQTRLSNEVLAAEGQEKATYTHGEHVLGWILAHQINRAQQDSALFIASNLEQTLSGPFDQLRQLLWEETQPLIGQKGALALFKSQTDVIPLLEKVLIKRYGLVSNPVLNFKRQQQDPNQHYPENLFKYILEQAPQIGNLT